MGVLNGLSLTVKLMGVLNLGVTEEADDDIWGIEANLEMEAEDEG